MLPNVKQCERVGRALGKDILAQWSLGCGSFKPDGPNQSGSGQLVIPFGWSKRSDRYWHHRTKHGAITTAHHSNIVMDEDRETDRVDCTHGAPARKAAKKAPRKVKASTQRQSKSGKRGQPRGHN